MIIKRNEYRFGRGAGAVLRAYNGPQKRFYLQINKLLPDLYFSTIGAKTHADVVLIL